MPIPAPFGSPVLVNTTVTGDQHQPAVVALANGQFVAVWNDSNLGGRGRLFHADGTPASGEFLLNSSQQPFAVAPRPDGGFVMTWQNGLGEIACRFFNPDGTPDSGLFDANETTMNLQSAPSIATRSDGGFVITWVHHVNATDTDIYARAFDIVGTPVSGDVQVDTSVAAEHSPVVAGLLDGDYVVVWVDEGSAAETDGSGSHIRARIYAENGTPIGNEFVVNTTTAGNQTDPAVAALPDGRFMVTWTDPGDGGQIVGRVFAADGTPAGDDYLVTPLNVEESAVAAIAGGRFFNAFMQTVSGEGYIRGDIRDAGSGADGGAGMVLTSPDAHGASVATLADGRVVMLWTDSGQNPGDTSGDAVRAQIVEVRDSALIIAGTALDDEWVGTAFDDVMKGAGGNDRLAGAGGLDTLIGGNGNDHLDGGAGIDTLEGGAGADELLGGGEDTASYSSSNAGVTISLEFGVATGGHATGDALHSVRNLIGSPFADVLGGNSQQGNTLTGGGGDDRLKGGGGNDTLDGGAGNDELFGGADWDTAVYSGVQADYLLVPLTDGSVQVIDQRPGSPNGTDTLDGVEYLVFADDSAFVTDFPGLDAPALATVLWQSNNGLLATEGHHFGLLPNDLSVAGLGDLDGDGSSEILFRGSDGYFEAWRGPDFNDDYAYGQVATTWQIRATGDFDADGDADILWRHQDGQVVTWEMENGLYVVNHNLGSVPTTWQIAGTGDFDADGDADILWRHQDGQVVTWEMENGAYVVNHNLGSVPTTWQIRGIGDFDADGDADILWHHTDGDVVTWEMEDGAYVVNHNLPTVSSAWQIAATHDFDSDGDTDILFRHNDGDVVTWDMENGAYLQNHNYGPVWNAWRVVGTGEFDLA